MPLICIVNKRGHKPKDYDYYCGRGSALGNPYKMRSEADRDAVCDNYAHWFGDKVRKRDKDVINALSEIQEIIDEHGKVNLVCFCKPKRCHCETIAHVLNAVQGERKANRENNVDVIIHTDGSCRKNPGPGGWGAILRMPTKLKHKYLKGADPDTTNNRMELMAAIEALRWLSKRGNFRVALYTDSQYVQKGMKQWRFGWRRKGWKTSTGTEVKNADLWKQLDTLAKNHEIDWRWVRGHNGDKYNEMADRLANEGAVEAGHYKS